MNQIGYRQGIRRGWLFGLLVVIVSIVPHFAFAQVVGPPPTCTDPVNDTPIYENGTWLCVPFTDPTAQREIWWLTNNTAWAAANDCSTCYCPPPSYIYFTPDYGNLYDNSESALCVPQGGSPPWDSPVAEELNYLMPATVNQNFIAANNAYQAQQAAIAAANAAQAAADRKEGTAIGGVLCTVASWFTGNVGKGLAVIGVSILGIALAKGKISMRTVFFVALGIAIIFGAAAIANALGQNISLSSCGTTFRTGLGWYGR
jgi:type IV secretory pathway VirB2 component (pilin)